MEKKLVYDENGNRSIDIGNMLLTAVDAAGELGRVMEALAVIAGAMRTAMETVAEELEQLSKEIE